MELYTSSREVTVAATDVPHVERCRLRKQSFTGPGSTTTGRAHPLTLAF